MKWLDNCLMVGWVRYGLCLDKQEYEQAVRKMKVESPTDFLIADKPATTHFFHLKEDRNDLVAIVCIGDVSKMDSIAVATLLVHEAVHIWQEEVEMMDEENPGHEIEAYAIQRISTNLMRAYVEMTS